MSIFDYFFKRQTTIKVADVGTAPSCELPKMEKASTPKEPDYKILYFWLDCSHSHLQDKVLKKESLLLPMKTILIDEDDETRMRYNVNTIPHFILVDTAGNELSRWDGETEPGEINDFLADNGYVSQKLADEYRDAHQVTPSSLPTIKFHSNYNIRNDENRKDAKELNDVTLTIEPNVNGCQGFELTPGDGYIVRARDNKTGKAFFSPKPVRLVSYRDYKAVFGGYPTYAVSPFGLLDYTCPYEFEVRYFNGEVEKFVMRMKSGAFRSDFMYDESIKPAVKLCEAELLALQAVDAARNGDNFSAESFAGKSLSSYINNPGQIKDVRDSSVFALAYGKYLEGDHFHSTDQTRTAAGITFYFLCRAIKEGKKDPYLYVYKASTAYEYNKAMYYFMAQASGRELNDDIYDPFANAMMMKYDHDLEGMIMADMLTERRVERIDQAMANYFRGLMNKYRNSDPEKIVKLGNTYSDNIYFYLKERIEDGVIIF